MNQYIKNSIAIFIFVLTFVLGYVRELFFLTINAVLNKTPYPYSSTYIQPPTFLYEYNNSTLVNIKWGFTLFFSLLFCLLTLFLIHFYFKNKIFNRITWLAYLIFFIGSLLIALVGIYFDLLPEVYPISRFITGLIQSPLSTIVLFVLYYYKTKSIQK